METLLNEPIYKADIILAKKNTFEAKLYSQILKSLGYSFEVVESEERLLKLARAYVYKIIVLDKELGSIKLSDFSQEIKDLNHNTKIILIDKPSAEEDANDKMFVDEVIRTIVNKELLKVVFEKHIEGNE